MLTSLSAPDLTFVFITIVLSLASAVIGLLAQMSPQLQRIQIRVQRTAKNRRRSN